MLCVVNYLSSSLILLCVVVVFVHAFFTLNIFVIIFYKYTQQKLVFSQFLNEYYSITFTVEFIIITFGDVFFLHIFFTVCALLFLLH